ncbi:MAG: hypothetical protein ACI82F_002883 [Planctomycetota bacterium]
MGAKRPHHPNLNLYAYGLSPDGDKTGWRRVSVVVALPVDALICCLSLLLGSGLSL